MGELAVWQNPTEVVVVHDRCTNVGRVLLAGDPARHKLNVGNLVIQESWHPRAYTTEYSSPI
jgi:hypothetical protein